MSNRSITLRVAFSEVELTAGLETCCETSPALEVEIFVGWVETELRLKVFMGQCGHQIRASVKLKDSSLIVCKS